MDDLMDTSEVTSPITSAAAIDFMLRGFNSNAAIYPRDQCNSTYELYRLNQELNSTKRELELARHDCHQMNHVLTSMTDYFMTDSGYDTNTAVESSLADHKTSIAPQPLVSFDDDNFSDYNNCHGWGLRNCPNTSEGSAHSDLISLCASESSTSWSSCATGSASQPSKIDDSGIQCDSADDDIPACTGEVLQDVGWIGQEFNVLDIEDGEDIEKGEIIEQAPENGLDAMPATFWKYIPDSPHPRNFLNLGISFDPENPSPENLKCVLIRNLPRGVQLQRVLSQVRGGDVVKCTLVPAADLQGYDAAYVQFKYASAAAEYADFTKSHPLFLSGYQMIVEHLPTPTYPLSPMIRDAVYRYGCTRSLRVMNIPRAITTRRLNDIFVRHFHSRAVIDAIHDDGTREAVIMRFSSVEVAGRAWWLLKFSGRYFGDQLQIEYMPDLCNLPLSTLLLRPGCRYSEKLAERSLGDTSAMDY